MAKEKTEELPGVTGPGVGKRAIKELDAAIEEWRGIVDKRMKLTEKEVEARTAVINLMHSNGLSAYEWQDADDTKRIVKLTSTEKVKLEKPECETVSEED
jgi:hypothetical protein